MHRHCFPPVFLFITASIVGLFTLGSGLASIGSGSAGAAGSAQPIQSEGPRLGADLLNPKTVEPITADQFRQILAHYRGKVLLVNLWATWCIPCVREMPDLSKLQQKLESRGLKVIGVSMDDAQDLDSRVRPFFKKRSVSYVSYLQNQSEPEEFVSVLDEGWDGILPTTYVIDRSGKLRKKLVGSKTFDEFAAIVTPLLNGKP